jgi:hypothetical protein
VLADPLPLQVFVDLLRNDPILHPFQQGVAFLQTQTQCFHRQFRPFDLQHFPALFSSVRIDAHDRHVDVHGWNLAYGCN